MEHKQTEALILSTDEAQGIVEAVWAVMGNVDEGDDVIHPGSFTKTFRERKEQVNLLDNHRTDSVMSALGTVLDLKELSRSELPSELLQQYPEATGGAWGQFQFLLDTLEGKGAFTRIKNKAVKKWSFGYDSIIKDFGKALKNGKERTVRNLRELKLYEISPVLFAMNEATTTTGVKAASEAKPYQAIREGDKWEVYKLDEDGKPTGSSLGSHDSQEEANRQVAALYANEDKAGRVLNARNMARIQAAMKELHDCLMEAGMMNEDDDKNGATGPQKSDDAPTSSEAGPPEDDSTRLKTLIQIEQEALKLMEVQNWTR